MIDLRRIGCSGRRRIRRRRRLAVNDWRLEKSPAHREAKLFNACPSLIHIAAEHASDSWASMVRQLGYAHGLRGATSAPLDTLKTIRSNPDGPNFVLGGVNTPGLSALSKVLRTVAARDAPRLTQSKLLFFIGSVRDPLERAVSSYMQYGVARRGWQPSVENFQSFVFGRYGRSAHVANIQFKTLAPESLVSKALDVESHAHNASAVTDEDIVSVLNFYDLLSTPEYESVSKLFLKQMLYRIVSVRQILDRPRGRVRQARSIRVPAVRRQRLGWRVTGLADKVHRQSCVQSEVLQSQCARSQASRRGERKVA